MAAVTVALVGPGGAPSRTLPGWLVLLQLGMPGGPSMSMPYSAARAASCAGSGGWLVSLRGAVAG